ncbi:DNA damage-inducible protein 1, partial [Dictyocoela muelleri]
NNFSHSKINKSYNKKFNNKNKFNTYNQIYLPKIVSTYQRHLLGLVSLREHDNMNSYVRRPDLKNNNFQRKIFNMQLADTDITTSVEIEILESVEVQNVTSWSNNIKELVDNNKYSKNGFLANIRALLSEEYKEKIENIKDPNKALDNIMKLRYNKYYSERLKIKVLKTKQEKFYTIDVYFNELCKIIKEISECNKWSPKESEILLESKFSENLTVETRMKMREFEKYGYEEILKYIRHIEKGLIFNSEFFKDKKQYKSEETSEVKREFNKKYCTYHKSNSHETKECKALNDTNKNIENKKTFMIKTDEKEKSDSIYLEGKINGHQIKCILDTSSTHSIINTELCNKMRLEKEKFLPISLKTASNDNIKSCEVVKTQINFIENKNALFNIELLVIKELPIDLIIGNKFLITNKANLSLNHNTLELSGFTFNLNSSQFNDDNSNLLFNLKTTEIHKKISSIIKSDDLGKCLSENHHIHLISEPNSFKKQYSVPFAIREKAKKHLNSLLEIKIIQKSNSNF